MPVIRLLVEGKLEVEVFGPSFAGAPVVDPRPSGKNSLAPRTRDLRQAPANLTACYIRDRDFDFLPPLDFTRPTIDNITDVGATLGWRWCRHEIENYFIDPSIVHATFGWDRAEFEAQLVSVARRIRHYQAARWAIAQLFPPELSFQSKPPECVGREFQLPPDLTEAGTSTWVRIQAASYVASVQTALSPVEIGRELTTHSDQLTEAFLGDVANALIWCSGKDLLAGLMPWLHATHGIHPSLFRNRVRDWMLDNLEQTLVLLPEWAAFRTLLRAY